MFLEWMEGSQESFDIFVSFPVFKCDRFLLSGKAAKSSSEEEEEEEEEGSDIETKRVKRLEKAKSALKDSDEESEHSKKSSRYNKPSEYRAL